MVFNHAVHGPGFEKHFLKRQLGFEEARSSAPQMMGLGEAKAQVLTTGRNGARRVDTMHVEGASPTVSAVHISIQLNTGGPVMCQLLCQMPRRLKYKGHLSSSRFLAEAAGQVPRLLEWSRYDDRHRLGVCQLGSDEDRTRRQRGYESGILTDVFFF